MSTAAMAGFSDHDLINEVMSAAGGTHHKIAGRFRSPDGRLTIDHVEFLHSAHVIAVVVNGSYFHQFVSVSRPVFSDGGRHAAYWCESMPDPDMDDDGGPPSSTWIFVDGHRVCSDGKVSNLAFTDDGAFVTFTTDDVLMRVISTPETPHNLFEVS